MQDILRTEHPAYIPPSPIEREKKPSPSLQSQALDYLAKHESVLRTQTQDHALGEKYGESIVRGKILACAQNIEACSEAYIQRRKETQREADKKQIKDRLTRLTQARLYKAQSKFIRKLTKQVEQEETRVALGLKEPNVLEQDALRSRIELEKQRLKIPPAGLEAESTSDTLLLEEASQEYALQTLDQKIAQGFIDPRALNAQMWLELELPRTKEAPVTVNNVEDVLQTIDQEVRGFIDKGFITAAEARTINIYTERYAQAFQKGFEKRFGPKTTQELYELCRDNARKIAYQTKMDKRTLAGSDHGVRHIYEGNTFFAEQLMTSLRETKGVDFKTRDEVLIRQIIIDHDMGYTTQAALTKAGGGAAKDHPCIGCRYIETNQAYYQHKFGQQGYDVIRDVLLNHSYPSSKYDKKRPDAPFSYNRSLIRSVVSTVDSLSTTQETKAMGLFRFPEAIDILQNARLYIQTHDGEMDVKTLDAFKQDFHTLIDTLVQEGRIRVERAQEYHQAVERKLDAKVIQKTFGQFAGVVREVRLVKNKRTKELVPEVRMDLSRLQSLVAEAFGDPVSIAGFKKAMEAFGLPSEELKRLGKLVLKLRRETDPKKRSKIQTELRFETDRAQFTIGEQETTGLKDEREDEHNAILERFEVFHLESARDQISALFDDIFASKKPREPDLFSNPKKILADIFDSEDPSEQERLKTIGDAILKNLNDDHALEVLQLEVKKILSKNERARLAGKL